MGYFGFSFYEENQDKVKALEIDGGNGCVAPVAGDRSGRLVLAARRPLFVYPSAERSKNADG